MAHDVAELDATTRFTVLYAGRHYWMKDVALPFAADLGTALARGGIARSDETIAATSRWYPHVEPTATLDVNDYLTVQFLVSAGIGPWAMGHGLDAASKGVTSAIKKLIKRHRKNTAGQPSGVAFRVEADFEPDETVVVLESELHYDTDPAEIADTFATACRSAARTRSHGVVTYRASGSGIRRVAGDRGRATRRQVLAYSSVSADPTAGPLQRAIAASGAESVNLLAIAQFLERHPGHEFPVELIAKACGCTPRLVSGQFRARIGPAGRHVTRRVIRTPEPWGAVRTDIALRYDPPAPQ